MILEVVILDVIPGREQEFETAFREASSIIASMAGYSSHQLQRCLEKQNRYLLLANGILIGSACVKMIGEAKVQLKRRSILLWCKIVTECRKFR